MTRFYVVADYGQRQPVETVEADRYRIEGKCLVFTKNGMGDIVAYRNWLKVTTS